MKNLSHFSKTDIRFWQGAVFRRPYTVDGERYLTKEWYARIQFRGKRQFFSLSTPNKAAAAAKARDIYLSLVASGWEATLARFKAAKTVALVEQGRQPCTVGEFLDEVRRTASDQRTVEGYAKKFRQIVSEIFELSDGQEKHDYRLGGVGKWLDKVHYIKLAEVTPARVQRWKQSFLAKAGTDPLALRRARISVNSMLRQARSLLSIRRLRHLQLSLSNPLPFEGVQFEPRQSMKYRSEIDLVKLIKTAKADLRDFLARRIQGLSFGGRGGPEKKRDRSTGVVVVSVGRKYDLIEPTRYFHPKSEDSIADLPVDREIMDVFRGYY
jgi:hypothetical protein